jgi:hypothetical protein
MKFGESQLDVTVDHHLRKILSKNIKLKNKFILFESEVTLS